MTQVLSPTRALLSGQNPVDVIAMVNAICDLADEAENKGLSFTEQSLRWVAMSLVQDLDGGTR